MDSNDLNLHQLSDAAKDSSHPERQLAAVKELREFTSGTYLTNSNVILCGIVAALVGCLKQHNHTELLSEATRALMNIAGGTSEETNQVVAAGAVPLFLQFLSSPAPDVCENAVWALANIVGDGPELRNHVIKHGCVRPILSLIKPDLPISLLKRITWLLSNLVLEIDSPPPVTTISEILPALNDLIHHTDTDILVDILGAIQNLSKGPNYQIQMVIESNILPKLIPLLGHTDFEVLQAAISALNDIVCGTDEQTQAVLNYDTLSYFPALLTNANERTRILSVKFLSNIAAGNQSQGQAIIDIGLLPKIFEILSNDEIQIQKEAAFVITNFTIRDELIGTLINEGVIGPFCDLLGCQDTEVICVVLRGLDNMLNVAGSHVADLINECNGKEKIYDLLGHDKFEVYSLAFNIMEEHFFPEWHY